MVILLLRCFKNFLDCSKLYFSYKGSQGSHTHKPLTLSRHQIQTGALYAVVSQLHQIWPYVTICPSKWEYGILIFFRGNLPLKGLMRWFLKLVWSARFPSLSTPLEQVLYLSRRHLTSLTKHSFCMERNGVAIQSCII